VSISKWSQAQSTWLSQHWKEPVSHRLGQFSYPLFCSGSDLLIDLRLPPPFPMATTRFYLGSLLSHGNWIFLGGRGSAGTNPRANSTIELHPQPTVRLSTPLHLSKEASLISPRRLSLALGTPPHDKENHKFHPYRAPL
jgi:hypothetical protein